MDEILSASVFGDHAKLRRALENILAFSPVTRIDQATDRNGYSALHLAVASDSYECVRLLLSAGANPNLETPVTLWTPLHLAAHSSSVAIAALLCASGANRDVQDAQGREPIDLTSDGYMQDFLRHGLQITEATWRPDSYARLWIDYDDTFYVRIKDETDESSHTKIGVLVGWGDSQTNSNRDSLRIHVFDQKGYEKLYNPQNVSHISYSSLLDSESFILNSHAITPVFTSIPSTPSCFSACSCGRCCQERSHTNSSPKHNIESSILTNFPVTKISGSSPTVQTPQKKHAKSISQSSSRIPFFRSSGLMWTDTLLFPMLNELLGHESLLIAETLEKHGFDAWFTGPLLSELLVAIYAKRRRDVGEYAHYKRMLVTTAKRCEVIRLVNTHSWHVQDKVRYADTSLTEDDSNPDAPILLGNITIRCLIASGHPRIFCDPVVSPTSLSLYYNHTLRYLYDPYGCGLKQCLLEQISLPNAPLYTTPTLLRDTHLLARSLLVLSRPAHHTDQQNTDELQSEPSPYSTFPNPDQRLVISAMHLCLRLFPDLLVQAFLCIRVMDLVGPLDEHMLMYEIVSILAPLLSHSTSLETLSLLLGRVVPSIPLSTPWRARTSNNTAAQSQHPLSNTHNRTVEQTHAQTPTAERRLRSLLREMPPFLTPMSPASLLQPSPQRYYPLSEGRMVSDGDEKAWSGFVLRLQSPVASPILPRKWK